MPRVLVFTLRLACLLAVVPVHAVDGLVEPSACDVDLREGAAGSVFVHDGKYYSSRVDLPFRNAGGAGFRVELATSRGRRYLTADQVTRMQSLAGSLRAKRGPVEEHVAHLATLIDVTERKFERDFRDNRERVVRTLTAKAELVARGGYAERAAFLRRLVTTITEYERPLTLEKCGAEWSRALREMDLPVDSKFTLDPVIANLRANVNRVLAQPSAGDFTFVTGLTALGTDEQRAQIKSAMEDAYHHPQAIVRDQRRAEALRTAPQSDVHYAGVPDLNTALEFLTEPPRTALVQSKIIAVGTAVIGGVPTPVEVRFDPRVRYFTVNHGKIHQYYQAVVTTEGHLNFLNLPPVSTTTAARRLDLTHFAY